MPTQDDLIKLAPPNNIEAEQAVLGSMMSKASAVADAVEMLKTEDFYRELIGLSLTP